MLDVLGFGPGLEHGGARRIEDSRQQDLAVGGRRDFKRSRILHR
jgi:hypothetical protein